MRTEDIIRGRIREALSEQRGRLLRSLRNLDIWEGADIEPFIDEMRRQAWQAQLKQRSWLNLEENYSKHELGLRRVLEVDTYGDKGGDECQINKAIQKAAAVSDKISGKKPRKARKLLETFASAGYYAYLVLRKKLGVPCEHPVLKPWYAKFLPLIPGLINPGGYVMLKEGTYTLSSGIVINANYITLEGVGSATLLKTTGMSDNFILVGGANQAKGVHIRKLRIDGTNQTTSAYGIENAKEGCGILIDDENDVGVEYSLVESCIIENVANEGITLFGRFNGARELFGTVFKNVIVNAAYRGIHTHDDHTVIAIGNTIRDCTGSNFDTGIRHSEIIANNRFYNVRSRCIYGSNISSIVAHNSLVDIPAGGDGIRCWNTRRDLIVGNYIANSNVYYAIHASYMRGAILNNKIYNVGYSAIRVYGADRCFVVGNEIRDARTAAGGASALELGGATYCYVAHNQIINTATNKPDYCIEEWGSGDNNIIINNRLEGYNTAAIGFVGSNTLVRNNFGFSNIKTVTANYTMTWADETILADASGGAITVTLPDPAAYPNYEVMIKKIDSSANAVTVAPHGTETIDGASSLTLANQNDAVRLRSDGTNWFSF